MEIKPIKVLCQFPYNVNFELAILSKNQDDALQILEQILPHFQPSFNITMNLVADWEKKRLSSHTLSVEYDDQYEGDYDTRRTLIYTLQFVAKTYLYGPVSDKSGEVITKAIVDYATDAKVTAPREDVTQLHLILLTQIQMITSDSMSFTVSLQMESPETQSQTQTSKFDGIADAMDVSTDIIKPPLVKPEVVETATKDRTQKDYEYTRGNLYSLIDKGQEAVDGILELAQESDQPRAYEVAGQLIKHVGDVADKLVDLQKKVADIEAPKKKEVNTTNNTMFVGSTADLAKFLKQQRDK